MKNKKSERHKETSPSERGPFLSSHPLNGVSLDLRRRIAVEHGKKAREEFNIIFPKIIELISRIDPFHTLALMTMYGLMVSPEQQGSHKKPANDSQLQQGHLELLQALCLRNPIEISTEFPDPRSIQMLFDYLPALFNAYSNMHLDRADELKELSKNEASIMQVQSFMRSHTSVVRNWGYFGSVILITKRLFSKLDPDYQPLTGMKLSTVVELFEWLVRRHEAKINEHRQKVHGTLGLNNKEKMITKFFETFNLTGAVEDFREKLNRNDVSREQVRFALLPWSDRFLGPTLIISNQEIAEEFGLPLSAVRTLMNNISLSFGDLTSRDPETFFLSNPVWLRPMIYLKQDYYFCALPQTLVSFIVPLVDELLAPYQGLQKKLSIARSDFLEEEVSRLFDKAFPGSKKCRGFKWIEGSQQFESDLAVCFDTTLILIEAKSGRVSWPALRGAPKRLIEHINKLIVEPSDQSGRLAQRIERELDLLHNNTASTFEFPIPLEGITCVIRLSVMLHDFATIQSVPSMLENAGILNNKYPLAPCISLADLEVMLDLLDAPSVRLHYLRRRAELSTSLHTVGDELDMLGMYLDTAFDLGKIKIDENTIVTYGYSADIDRYYSLRDELITINKPKPNTSEWFRRLCEQLETRARPGWSELACALLSVAPADQTKIWRSVKILAAIFKNGKAFPEQRDSIVLIPPMWATQAIAIQVKRRDSPVPYGSDSQNIAQQAFESQHITRCFVLVVDATDAHLSYLSAAMFKAEGTKDVIFY